MRRPELLNGHHSRDVYHLGILWVYTLRQRNRWQYYAQSTHPREPGNCSANSSGYRHLLHASHPMLCRHRYNVERVYQSVFGEVPF